MMICVPRDIIKYLFLNAQHIHMYVMYMYNVYYVYMYIHTCN